jgi:hypothetical protein
MIIPYFADSIFGYGTDGSDFRPQNVVVGQRYSDDIRYHTAAEITKEPEDAPYGTGIPEIDSPDKVPPRVKPPPKPVVVEDGPKLDSREEAFAKRLALAKMEMGADESKLYVRLPCCVWPRAAVFPPPHRYVRVCVGHPENPGRPSVPKDKSVS